jgi:lipopolysaccharide heptosyltransferase II
VNYDRHAIDRYLDVAERLGWQRAPWKGEIALSDADQRSATSLLAPLQAKGRPIVAINPMARWESKLWLPERFATLADALAPGGHVVFTGSLNDRGAIEDILKQMKAPALNLAGRTTLKELAAVLTRAAVLVCTDTGPMHIASAMGCPVVALFGPTAPWRTGPYGAGHRVIRSASFCSPCYKKSCQENHCMREITVDQVTAAVREVLCGQSSQGNGEIPPQLGRM